MADGTGLDTAMASHPRVFSPLSVSMVRAGLEGAFLEEALERIASFLRKQESLRMKIIGSMTYPAILAVVGVGVTIFLVMFVVPDVPGVLRPAGTLRDRAAADHGHAGGDQPVPGALRRVRRRRPSWRWSCSCATGWARPPGGALCDRWKLKIPVAGRIFHDAAVARLCRVLGTLLRNGVPLLTALRISSESTGNQLLQQAVLESVETVSSGDSLSRPLAASGSDSAPSHGDDSYRGGSEYAR